MFHVVWEFRVRAAALETFVRRYGPEGDWVQLFRRAPGYVGTVLMQDRREPQRFLVTDTWRDAASHAAFKADRADEYAALDHECEALTEDERCLGEFDAT